MNTGECIFLLIMVIIISIVLLMIYSATKETRPKWKIDAGAIAVLYPTPIKLPSYKINCDCCGARGHVVDGRFKCEYCGNYFLHVNNSIYKPNEPQINKLDVDNIKKAMFGDDKSLNNNKIDGSRDRD